MLSDGSLWDEICSARRARAFVIGALAALAALMSTAPAQASTVRSGAFGAIYEHINYGPRFRQTLNVFASPISGSPIVVLIHGGGWRFYDALSRFESQALFLQGQGNTVFNINYDQDSPTTPAFSLEPEDVTLAVQWAIAHAAEYSGNPHKVVLLGSSAGGHLAATVAEKLDSAAPGTVAGVVLLSPPTDLTRLTSEIAAGSISNEEFVISERQAVGRDTTTGEPYLYTLPWQQEAYERRWSPALTASSTCPKWLIFNSTEEFIPISQAQELNTNLHGKGCSSTLVEVPGTRHAFGYWSRAAFPIAEFIRGL